MRLFYKIASIILAIGFVFVALVFFAIGSVGGGVLFLLVAVVFPMLIMASANNRINEVLYNSKMVQGQAFQFLETLYLILNTKNKDTLERRIKFVNKIYPNLIKVSASNIYHIDVKFSIAKYEKLYPNKTLNTEDILLLTQPDYNKLNDIINRRLNSI